MKSRFGWACAVMTGSVFMAASTNAAENDLRAVRSTTFDLGLDSRNIETADSTSSGTVDFSGMVTAPIGKWLGLSVDLGYSESRVRTGDVLGTTGSTTVSGKG